MDRQRDKHWQSWVEHSYIFGAITFCLGLSHYNIVKLAKLKVETDERSEKVLMATNSWIVAVCLFILNCCYIFVVGGVHSWGSRGKLLNSWMSWYSLGLLVGYNFCILWVPTRVRSSWLLLLLFTLPVSHDNLQEGSQTGASLVGVAVSSIEHHTFIKLFRMYTSCAVVVI